MNGLPEGGIQETCTAGAGSLLLEFGILSKLVGDPVFEGVARRAVDALLNYRSNITGLLGKCFNLKDLQSGQNFKTGKNSFVPRKCKNLVSFSII